MSYSISTLLTRNLHDVFGENDPARRRAAIDEIFTEIACSTSPEASTMAATRNRSRPSRHRLPSRRFGRRLRTKRQANSHTRHSGGSREYSVTRDITS